jgi:hypothetical protein
VAPLTWAVLLNQWMNLARGAMALGPDQQSQALRKIVPDIIMFQAVWYTLTDITKLEMTEQKLGCLRAQWLIDRHEKQIRDAWPDPQLPAKLEELIRSAKDALAGACKHISDHEEACRTSCPADDSGHGTST